MVQLDEQQNKTNLQKNSNNVIINPSEKTSLKSFDEHLASFDKCAQTKSDAIIGIDFYGSDRQRKCNETLTTRSDTITSTVLSSSIINKNNNNHNSNRNCDDDKNRVDNNNNNNNNNDNDNDDDDNSDEHVTSTTASPSYTNPNSDHLNYRYQKVYQDGTDKTGYYTNTFFVNNIKANEQESQQQQPYRSITATSIDLNQAHIHCTENQQRLDSNMGSNVSRNTAKGLSGRRTQSSGDLTNRNKSAEKSHPIGAATQAIDSSPIKDEDQISNTTVCLPAEHSHLTHVKRAERSKIFGSLPNHLDSEETYRENLYNKNKTHTKRPGDRNGMKCNGAPYPSPLPYKDSASKHSSHHQNTKLPYNNETGMHLKLVINRSNMDVGCDQGYGSERSPEDELPPILSIPYQSMEAQPLYQQKAQQYNRDQISETDFNFITSDCCFTVQVVKNERGLGISVYGGIDANVPYRGLIRIKRLFPNQSAWSTGMLQPGDILLEANEIPLTGLTNHEALEVLRTAPNVVNLKVCRPHDEQFRKLSPPTEPPKPPQRSQHTNALQQQQQQEPQSPLHKTFTGEFEIVMVKQQGSLGFTLRKEDDSVLGHYVRALVRDPAVSEGREGRIKPGDKIVAVNDVPLCPMSHEEAVLFLRQAKDRVKLRLFRDISQTPIASISPSSSEQFIPNTGKPKASLRPEAMNLLIDLAHKNRKQSCDSYSTESSSASPRRLRRNNNKHNSSDNNTNSYSENSTSKSFNTQNQTYTMPTQSSVCSDSEASTISQGSFGGQTVKKSQQQCNNAVLDSTFTVDNYYMPQQQQQQQQNRPCADDSEYYNDEELWRMMDVDESGSASSQSRDRPSYLDVYGNGGGYAVVTRKPVFQLSAANGYELNNLNNETLDAPVYNAMLANPNLSDQQAFGQDAINGDYTSLPCEAFSMASRTNSNAITNADEFSHKNPMYQSAHVQVTSKPIVNNEEPYSNADNSEEGTKNLLKWKGVMFGIDEPDNAMANVNAQTPLSNDTTLTTSSEPDSSCATMIEINQIATDNAKDINAVDDKDQEIITVELSRGWNSRLGFSLRTESNSKHTVISAIYSESVAAKDGRLRVGDRIVMVNDESVESMDTAQIIDLLRIVRGSIVLVVKRSRA